MLLLAIDPILHLQPQDYHDPNEGAYQVCQIHT